MATCSSIIPWKTPWTEELGTLQSMGLQSWTWLSEHTHKTNGANWGPLGQKGAHTPGVCFHPQEFLSCQKESSALPGCKGPNEINVSLSGQRVSLRTGTVLRTQCCSLVLAFGYSKEVTVIMMASVLCLGLELLYKLYKFIFVAMPACLVVSDSLWPLDSSPPGSSVHGVFQARILKWVVFFSPGDLLDSGIKPTSPVHFRQILYPLSHRKVKFAALHLKRL